MAIKWMRNISLGIVCYFSLFSSALAEDLSIHLQGVVMPAEQVNFSFGQSGILKTIAKSGHQLAKGDVVAELKSKIAQAELAKSDALVRAAQAKLASVKHNRDKSARLVKEDILSNIAVVEANFTVQSETENLAVAYTQQEIARQYLNQHVITAPFSGAVINVKMNPGEWINVAEPFITLVNFKKLNLSIDIPPKMIKNLSSGMSTEVILDDQVVGIAIAKTIFPIVDPASGLLRVVWQIIPNEGMLLSGRYVTLQSWHQQQKTARELP